VEKAHSDVFNILLQVFDDGRLTDSKGRTVNCKNALFIMTSNLGSDLLLEKASENKLPATKEGVLAVVEPRLRSHFRPEFLNRIDEVLPFIPLQEKDMEKIVEIQLAATVKRVRERDIDLAISPGVIAHLAAKGYDPLYGARPLKRLLQHEVVNLLSNAILRGNIISGNRVELDLSKEKQVVLKVV